jgi:hypothetical protein
LLMVNLNGLLTEQVLDVRGRQANLDGGPFFVVFAAGRARKFASLWQTSNANRKSS